MFQYPSGVRGGDDQTDLPGMRPNEVSRIVASTDGKSSRKYGKRLDIGLSAVDIPSRLDHLLRIG